MLHFVDDVFYVVLSAVCSVIVLSRIFSRARKKTRFFLIKNVFWVFSFFRFSGINLQIARHKITIHMHNEN